MLLLIKYLVFILSQVKSRPFKVTKGRGGASIDMSWDEDDEVLVMTTKVPAGTHLGFGWGPNMVETSMVSWHANGADSYVTELYSE